MQCLAGQLHSELLHIALGQNTNPDLLGCCSCLGMLKCSFYVHKSIRKAVCERHDLNFTLCLIQLLKRSGQPSQAIFSSSPISFHFPGTHADSQAGGSSLLARDFLFLVQGIPFAILLDGSILFKSQLCCKGENWGFFCLVLLDRNVSKAQCKPFLATKAA